MWLKDIDRQIEAQAHSSSMTKLTPDEGYTGMYYLVHPDYLDRLLEIAKGSEWEDIFDRHNCIVNKFCPICGQPQSDGHVTTCPYSDEYKGG